MDRFREGRYFHVDYVACGAVTIHTKEEEDSRYGGDKRIYGLISPDDSHESAI